MKKQSTTDKKKTKTKKKKTTTTTNAEKRNSHRDNGKRRNSPLLKYKSKWEMNVADQIRQLGFPVLYEVDKISYVIPEHVAIYNPDFTIGKGVFIEAKGKWDAKDRQKHLLLKTQFPDIKIYLVFQNANQRINKKSKTTYGEWATKHGIPWSHKVVNPEWFSSSTPATAATTPTTTKG